MAQLPSCEPVSGRNASIAAADVPTRRRATSARRRGEREVAGPRRRGDERGDTLIEVLLSLVILGLGALAMMVAFGTSLTASGQHRNLTTAETLAKNVANHVASAVQTLSTNFTCAPPMVAPYTAYQALTSGVNLPTHYSATVTNVQYWRGSTSSWGATCRANAPQLIDLAVTSPSGASNTASVVVDNPSAPTVPVTSTATQLVFTVMPSGAAVGATMSVQPQLAYEDALGVVATNYFPPTPVTLTVIPVAPTTTAATLSKCVKSTSPGYVNFKGCQFDAVGTYRLEATDGTFGMSPNPPILSDPITVSKGVNTITVSSSAPSMEILGSGGTYTPTATALSGDGVTVTSATAGVCSVSPAHVVNFIGAGVCAINFDDPGNTSWNAAPTVAQGIPVYLPNKITVDSPVPAAVVGGATYKPSVHATSGDAVVVSSLSPSVCIVASGVVSFVATGTCSLEFDDPGNQTYVAASATPPGFTVNRGANVITVTSTPPTPSAVGTTYTPTATATSGAVIVTSSPSSTCSVSSGVVSFKATGSCTIYFNDPGNSNFVAAKPVLQSPTITAAP